MNSIYRDSVSDKGLAVRNLSSHHLRMSVEEEGDKGGWGPIVARTYKIRVKTAQLVVKLHIMRRVDRRPQILASGRDFVDGLYAGSTEKVSPSQEDVFPRDAATIS